MEKEQHSQETRPMDTELLSRQKSRRSIYRSVPTEQVDWYQDPSLIPCWIISSITIFSQRSKRILVEGVVRGILEREILWK